MHSTLYMKTTDKHSEGIEKKMPNQLYKSVEMGKK